MALTRARLWSRIVSRPAAQACSVVRVEKFLSDSDIATVLQLRDSHAIAHGPAVEVRSGWKTTYLNADGLFCARAPDLLKRLRSLPTRVDRSLFFANDSARRRDGAAVEELLTSELNIRCAEFHDVAPGGTLSDPGHFDNGSVVTVDVMLSDDFEGGDFQTREVPPASSSSSSSSSSVMASHTFRRGDALIFPSHKYHTVAPVTRGIRQVLVLEFWKGEEKRCNHRCEVPRGDCDGTGRPLSVASSRDAG